MRKTSAVDCPPMNRKPIITDRPNEVFGNRCTWPLPQIQTENQFTFIITDCVWKPINAVRISNTNATIVTRICMKYWIITCAIETEMLIKWTIVHVQVPHSIMPKIRHGVNNFHRKPAKNILVCQNVQSQLSLTPMWPGAKILMRLWHFFPVPYVCLKLPNTSSNENDTVQFDTRSSTAKTCNHSGNKYGRRTTRLASRWQSGSSTRIKQKLLSKKLTEIFSGYRLSTSQTIKRKCHSNPKNMVYNTLYVERPSSTTCPGRRMANES